MMNPEYPTAPPMSQSTIRFRHIAITNLVVGMLCTVVFLIVGCVDAGGDWSMAMFALSGKQDNRLIASANYVRAIFTTSINNASHTTIKCSHIRILLIAVVGIELLGAMWFHNQRHP